MIADTTIDRKKSRRPLKRSDRDELGNLATERQRLEDRMEHLEEIVKAMDESPAYADVIALSHGRLKQIEATFPTLDSRDEIGHAELKGQWKERFLITQQHSDFLTEKEEAQKGLRRIGQTMMGFLKKLEKE